jgi:UDP-N-acetylmuramoyl-L-alanyl-D-glutamate--2,6-diaminopimelate ligase
MKLIELLDGIEGYSLDGDPETEIRSIAYDSRKIKAGALFVALKGLSLDGHAYIHDAVQRGAAAVMGEDLGHAVLTVPSVRVADSRRLLSLVGHRFYNHPFSSLDLVGITGTNGKTTTTFLLESILQSGGARPGVIGTINYRYAGRSYPASVTTPESLDLVALASEMVQAGTSHIIMEVSSHALHQGRTADCPFRTAVFTNLSRDHLDYHGDMEEYFRAKSILFRDLVHGGRSGAAVVINMDDPRGAALAGLTSAPVIAYGLRGTWDVRAESIHMDREGVRAELITPIGRKKIRSSLIGEFNIYNILAASAAAISLGIDLEAVAAGIEVLPSVPGRMEMVRNHRGLALVVDYAHTPDALQKTLMSLRPYVQGRMITVFGCGGDRDRGKRPEMGLIAGRESDLVFVTSDNPRTEEPLSIISEIEEGVRRSGLSRLEWPSGEGGVKGGYFTESDRREAIRKAVSIASPKDVVLIAGKGHEDYQIVGGERRPFDDRKEAAQAAMEAAA